MSMLGNNLLAQYYAQNQGLPFGYEAVEYLESTGTQWIDTGVYVNQDTEINIEAQHVTTSDSFSIFGVNPFFVITEGTGNFWALRYNNTMFNTRILGTNKIKINWHKNIANINNQLTHEFQYATFQSSVTSTLFARRSNNTLGIEEYAKTRLFTCQISKVRNYIPCIRKSDGKPGMYDLCHSICPLTGTSFYVNAGTGEFIVPSQSQP